VRWYGRGFLDHLGKQHGTDKASGQHNYLGFYEFFLAEWMGSCRTLLEIGVGGGGSLKMWSDWLPHTRVIGFDNDDGKKQYETDRIIIEIGNQADENDLQRLITTYAPLDIINDDGGHSHEQQLTSLRMLWPHLSSGGYYLLEDIGADQTRERLAGICGKIMQEREGDDPIASTCEFAAVFHGTIVMRKK
jgi:cephalosporin hydroxylase